MQNATDNHTPHPAINKKICGVYAWEHIPSGMLYIGSSVDCNRRKGQHQKSGRGHFYHRASELGWCDFVFHILQECLPENRLELEREWIQGMNSVHPEGFNICRDPTRFDNYMWTDEMREKASERMKAIWGTPEARKANSLRSRLMFSTPEARARASKQKKEWVAAHPEECSARIERMKITLTTPEFRAKQSERMRRIGGTPEAREANSKRQKIAQSKPEARKAKSARAKKWFEDNPDARIAASERLKNHYSNPEARTAQSERKKAYFSNPEARAAQSARTKAYFVNNVSSVCKAVNQYDLNWSLISTYESVTLAAKSTGFHKSSISVASNKGKVCCGYYWKYAGKS